MKGYIVCVPHTKTLRCKLPCRQGVKLTSILQRGRAASFHRPGAVHRPTAYKSCAGLEPRILQEKLRSRLQRL